MPPKGSDLARAMTKILTALCQYEGDVAIRDIAKECAIPKSTLHRTLQALKEEGWVHQGDDGSYRIGLRLLVLASQSRLRMELVKQLDPVMRRIASMTQQTVVLSVLDGKQSICLHMIESNKRIRINSQIGSRGDLHAGASGKVLLAFGPKELLDEVLATPLTKYTPFTLTEPADLRQEVEKILEKGYAISIEELDPGAAAIAAPILDTHRELIAGISIAGPRFDFDGNVEVWSRELRRLTEPVLNDDADREGVCLTL